VRKLKNQNGFSAVEALLVLIIVILIGIVGYMVYRNHHKASTSSATSTQSTNPYAGWKTFNSSSEGFSIKYPANWTTDPSTEPSDDSTDFDAPDGLIVRYVELQSPVSDSPVTDSVSCGTQSACLTQNILSINPLSIPGYGEVSFLTTAPDDADSCYGAYLDLPTGPSTTPKIGDNSYPNHFIQFSLPSKLGGRFSLFITNSRAGNTTFSCKNLTQKQFFANQSVEQAELILKSISYQKS